MMNTQAVNSFSRPLVGAIVTSLMLCFANPVSALFYDFSTPTGNLGSIATYTNGGVSITAAGFTQGFLSLYSASSLYGQNGGGDLVGLGIASNSNHQISSADFVQFDMINVWAANPTSISFTFGSASATQPWRIYGSNTSGSSLGTLLYSGTTDYPTAFILSSVPSGYRYLKITAQSKEVLVASINASIPAPEPGLLLLMGSTLGVVAAFRRKKAAASK